MNEVKLEAVNRKGFGTGNSERLRKAGFVPCVIYGGKKANVEAQISQKDLSRELEKEGCSTRVFSLDFGDKSEMAILKEVQHHPFKTEIVHVDFLRVNENDKVTIDVPVKFKNTQTAPGLKQGGAIYRLAAKISVSCLPKDIPAFLEIDLGNMELNTLIYSDDVKMPEGVVCNSVKKPLVSLRKIK